MQFDARSLRRSCGQTGGAHFVHEFPRSSRIEITPEQLTDFQWLRTKLLDKAAEIVAVARQLRLKVVQLTGEDRLDDAGIDRLRPDFEPDRARMTRFPS